ncbi:hypothetical protein TNCV_3310501 [Trichonephila clavipes]|nr:hypothetical protein TNCV_3310501 [Trichonephila clavipes]
MGCESIVNRCSPSTYPRIWYHFLVRCPIGGYQSPQMATPSMSPPPQFRHGTGGDPVPGNSAVTAHKTFILTDLTSTYFTIY